MREIDRRDTGDAAKADSLRVHRQVEACSAHVTRHRTDRLQAPVCHTAPADECVPEEAVLLERRRRLAREGPIAVLLANE
eukprot:7090825-Prymnesium_polylepis.1